MYEKWIIRAGDKGNYEKLFDLMVQEQLLLTFTNEVKGTICDKKPSTVLESAKIADKYFESRVHGGCKPKLKGNLPVHQVKR